jgi:leucyl/phenylalanyl-tRNA--protein transferase
MRLFPEMPTIPGNTTRTAEELAILRDELFHETPLDMLKRVALGCAWALKPGRARHLPSYGWRCLKNLVAPARGVPDPEQNGSADGTVGIVRDLSAPTITEAYKRGLFTAGHFGILTWSSPAERCVLFFDEYHMNKNVRRLLRQGRYTITFDRAFEQVIAACAGRRAGKLHMTWITPRIMHAYATLYDAGHVHSFEVWNSDGKLAGGGYGVVLGRVFFTESMFSQESDTSKIGLAVLNRHLAEWGYILNDGKKQAPTLNKMGFRLIPRAEFLRLLADNTSSGGKPGRWNVEIDPKEIANWQPKPELAAAE